MPNFKETSKSHVVRSKDRASSCPKNPLPENVDRLNGKSKAVDTSALKDAQSSCSGLYEPLTDPDGFRLLTVHSSTNKQSALRCTLKVASLKTASYNALSYCWGQAKVTKPIGLNHTTIQASENLVSALYHIRDEREDLVIWIDAICINQDDINERSTQVQKMGSIYSGASTVICWLGPAMEDSYLAFRMIRLWGEVMLRRGLDNFEKLAELTYAQEKKG